MTERMRGPDERISSLVAEMYAECDDNIDLYARGDFLEVYVDNYHWRISYQPGASHPDREALVLSKKEKGEDRPVVYGVRYGGTVMRFEIGVKRDEGGTIGLTSSYEPVSDVAVVEELRTVLSAAHEPGSPAA